MDNPKDLPEAVHDAFRAGQPVVVDVIIDQFEPWRRVKTDIAELARHRTRLTLLTLSERSIEATSNTRVASYVKWCRSPDSNRDGI